MGAGAVDHYVVRGKHGHSLLGGNGAFNPLNATLSTLGNQTAQAILDIVEAAEAPIPLLKQAKKLSVYRPPEFKARFKLTWLKDGRDVVPVNFIGTVGRDRVGDQIGSEPDHPRACIDGPLFVQSDGESFHRLKHGRHE